MQAGIDPRVDYAFKRVFGSEGSEPLLADLLNAALDLPAGRVVRELTYVSPHTEKEFVEGKVSVLDIRACDQAGRQFNLEMQRQVPWVFPKRALYYWAEVHGAQMHEGEDHVTLCPTFSLCFLDAPLFEDDRWHHRFRLLDDQGVLFCKDIEIHTLELGKFTLPAEQVQSPLERWIYFLKHGESLDDEHLPAALEHPLIRRALEFLMRLNQNEIERHLYQARQKAERDAATLARAAEYARDEGRQCGELVGRIHFCQRALKQALTPRRNCFAFRRRS